MTKTEKAGLGIFIASYVYIQTQDPVAYIFPLLLVFIGLILFLFGGD